MLHYKRIPSLQCSILICLVPDCRPFFCKDWMPEKNNYTPFSHGVIMFMCYFRFAKQGLLWHGLRFIEVLYEVNICRNRKNYDIKDVISVCYQPVLAFQLWAHNFTLIGKFSVEIKNVDSWLVSVEVILLSVVSLMCLSSCRFVLCITYIQYFV